MGHLDDILVDPDTGFPKWLLVRTGGSAERRAMVPFGQATQGGGHVWVPFERELIRRAPSVVSGTAISREMDSIARQHYTTQKPKPIPRAPKSAAPPPPDRLANRRQESGFAAVSSTTSGRTTRATR